jgi:hypothetical protein
MAESTEVAIVALLPAECDAVVQAAKLWLWTHPVCGPGQERAHKVAIESLIAAIRNLNNAETRMMEQKFSRGKR